CGAWRPWSTARTPAIRCIGRWRRASISRSPSRRPATSSSRAASNPTATPSRYCTHGASRRRRDCLVDGSLRMSRRTITVNDKMQKGYCYQLSAPAGRNFDPEFRPELTPRQMLRLGIFCGKYMTDCRKEFPSSWFAGARLATQHRDCGLNYFSVDASQPLSEWRRKGWLDPDDPRGWFQWYCRYYLGRRRPEED